MHPRIRPRGRGNPRGLVLTLLAAIGAGLGACNPGTAVARRLDSACEGGNAAACDSLGGRLQRGEYVLRDEIQAASLFERACTAGVG